MGLGERADIETDSSVAVIGAGPSGLATLKNLKSMGIPCVAYEAHQDLGGIWDRANPKSSVYRNTHTITSRDITAYADFPMDPDLPVYPRHGQVLEYLRAYAEHFDLRSSILFGHPVTAVSRHSSGSGWEVSVEGHPPRRHAAVVIANGHNWSPRYPDLPGEFTGETLHSAEYDDAASFAGKRVLVIGAGNSGCDIAVEAAQLADKVVLSARRGYTFFPKFLLGVPSDRLSAMVRMLRLPHEFTGKLMRLALYASAGRQSKLGLPPPDHLPLQTPPIVNSLVPYYAAHGRIDVRPAITRVEGTKVEFSDGTVHDFDVLVYATGYRIDIPFIDRETLNWKGEGPDLYLFAFSPQHDDLFVAGMTDGTGGHFPTVELQSRVIAAYLVARRERPEAAQRFDELRRRNEIDLTGGIRFLDISRNTTQFALPVFMQALREHLAILEGVAPSAVLPPTRRQVLRELAAALR